MRVFHKKKLLDMMDTIYETIRVIGQRLEQKDLKTALGLLEEIQESLLNMGNFIERMEGEGTKTVALMEEYCKVLYEAAEELLRQSDEGAQGLGASERGNPSPAYRPGKLCRHLNREAIRVGNSIRQELRERAEVLFLPYKASMWDSMESVWRAFREDPDCDTYVVPVPYYDRKPDGTLGLMHDESGMFPGNVEITHWSSYDLEERRPDITVIHNPYDDGNRVTSVHPKFYARELKQVTNLLVYIPYFIMNDDVPAHLCVCAGAIFADQVIVQSERVRDTYIREFHRFENENHCRGRFGTADKKFLAMGSPKVDKVLSTVSDDVSLPEEWRRLIEGAGGRRKKVIFYNTSLAGLLAWNKRFILKIRNTIEVFRSREDVVLWWRPHPLIEATVRSMRPFILKDYEELLEDYRGNKVGIYDDTPDLHRAIALSDAYYGDMSSVAALYRWTGKPMVIQNMELVWRLEGVTGSLAGRTKRL